MMPQHVEPIAGTIIDLGKRVKSKYPGQYDDMPDDEVGRKVKSKFPGQYDDFTDVKAPDPNAAVLAAQKARFPTAAEGGDPDLPWYAGYFGGGQQQPAPEPKTLGDTTLGALTVGVDPSRFLERIGGAAASVINPLLPTGDTRKPNAQLPAMTPDQEIGAKTMAVAPIAGAAAEQGANLFSRLKGAIPNAEHAGQLFQQIKGKAGDIPIDTAAADAATAAAQDVKATGGGSPPAPIREFIKARKPVTVKVDGVKVELPPHPITYATGRDFASNASRLSADEALKMSPQMKAKLTQFSLALKDANRQVAASVGMEDMYDAAMKEYHQAKTIEDAKEVLVKWLPRAAAALGLGASGRLGYELWKAH